VDIDLERFFDRVNHDILMSRVARRVRDKRVLKLICKYLEAGLMKNGCKVASEEETPQGGPLGPLLANIMLDELDKELEKREHRLLQHLCKKHASEDKGDAKCHEVCRRGTQAESKPG